ncbi:hypothetical protein HK104_004268 [Borealophlyctis nickersoniae]|nr:hypothetical protein HK104_004268 [Borealophlyctis nickersoniae]
MNDDQGSNNHTPTSSTNGADVLGNAKGDSGDGDSRSVSTGDFVVTAAAAGGDLGAGDDDLSDVDVDKTFTVAIVGMAGGTNRLGVLDILDATASGEQVDTSDSSSPLKLHMAKFQCGGVEYDLNLLKVDEGIAEGGNEAEICPKVISKSDGILLCYDLTNRASFLHTPELLDAFSETQIPTALMAWRTDMTKERQVEFKLGSKLAAVFNALFLEVLNPNEERSRISDFVGHLVQQMVRKRELAHYRNRMLKGARFQGLKSQLRQLRKSTLIAGPDDPSSPTEEILPPLAAVRLQDETVMYPMPNIRNAEEEEESAEPASQAKEATEGPGGLVAAPEVIIDSPKYTYSPSRRPIPTISEAFLANPPAPDSASLSSASSSLSSASIPTSPSIKEFPPSIKDFPPERSRRLSTRLDILDVQADSFSVNSILDDYVPKERRGSVAQSDSSVLSGQSNNSLYNCGTSVIGFTIEELVERLTSADTHDMEFTKVFLMLYRKFMRPSELLDRLMDRFDMFDRRDDEPHGRGGPIHPVQLRVCNVLIHWCTEYWYDFHSDKMRFTLHVFLEIISYRPAFAAVCQKLAGLVFREAPHDMEKEGIDWGIPDVDEEEGQPSPHPSEAGVGMGMGMGAAHVGAAAAGQMEEVRRLSGNSNNSNNGYGVVYAGLMERKVSLNSMSGSSSMNGDGYEAPNRRSAASTNTSLSSLSDTVSPRDRGAPVAGSSGGSSAGVLSVTTGVLSVTTSVDGMSTHRGVSSPVIPQSPVPQGLGQNTPFLELDNEIIARQLNVLESEIFRKIKGRDLLQHIWSRRHKGRHAPSVAASIGHFNFISAWVTTRVLAQRKVKARAKVLGKFMKIAQILRNSNNYNTLMAILAGINSAPLLRLRQTRKLLYGRQSWRNYEALEKLMSSERSFGGYRSALKRSEMPCIPYLGVFLRDLLYIDEANKDRRPDGTINLPKFLLMGDIVMMIKSFQVRPYNVPRDLNITALILGQPVMEDDEAYQRSLELEPRAPGERE